MSANIPNPHACDHFLNVMFQSGYIEQWPPMIWEIFGHKPVEILVFASPTDYKLTSSGFALPNWGIFYKFL